MHSFFVIILLLLCIAMFLVSRPTKMGILLVAGICIYEYHLNLGSGAMKDFGKCITILPLCFFVSEFNSFIHLIKKRSYSILNIFLLVGSLYVFYNILISPNMGTGIKYILISIVCRYLLPFFAFISIRKKMDVYKIYRITFCGVILMTFFGIINFISKHSVYVDWLLESESVLDYLSGAGSRFEYQERFRVHGTFSNPFDYGYACISILLFYWYGYVNKNVTYYQMIIVAGCTIFGIVSCNCRTVLLCSIIILLFFAIFSFKSSQYLKYIFALFCCLFVGVNFVPYLSEKMFLLTTMFDTDSQGVSGSSINLRMIQITSVFRYIDGKELTGCGLGYFSRNLGFAKGTMVDNSLGGLEGSYLQTLLETGIIGTIFYFGIIGLMLAWAWKKRKCQRVSSVFLFSLFSLFLLYGLLTGELRSAYITFLLSGIAIYDILIGCNRERLKLERYKKEQE